METQLKQIHELLKCVNNNYQIYYIENNIQKKLPADIKAKMQKATSPQKSDTESNDEWGQVSTPNTETRLQPQKENAAKKWVFTLNNPTQEEIEHIRQFYQENCKYLLFSYEHQDTTNHPEWTPHLQGMIQLNTKKG